ncbi:MAG: 1-acyl-sn-glycerol-3-phosphate acyltransferase [Bacteroidales bacterium]|nr:1-acyl-sn-glycerol-3-phosphate acyltransferase [Bacteroidales bacterium]
MEQQVEDNTQQEIGKKFIDLEKVVASKSEKLAKALPKFVINYLKRVIHQEEINKALYENRDKYGLDFIEAILDHFQAELQVEGKENIPKEGRLIIASNHPLGGLDGMALMKVVGEVRDDIVFPVNDLLMNLPNLRDLFIPINKHGSNAANIRVFEETFSSDKTVLYFPAGLCSRKQRGQIIDLEWKKSFITKARRHKRDVLPTYIYGRNSNFFYNLARLRSKLGIKANIEMLYLVDEMFKQKDKVIRIIFGKPIPYTTFDKRHTDREWARMMKKHVYAMGEAGESPLEPLLKRQ